jgi:hypothetical protein
MLAPACRRVLLYTSKTAPPPSAVTSLEPFACFISVAKCAKRAIPWGRSRSADVMANQTDTLWPERNDCATRARERAYWRWDRAKKRDWADMQAFMVDW